MAITQAEQVAAVANAAGITLQQARTAMDAVTAVVVTGLLSDGKLVLYGLGTFETRTRRPRRFRNPATGDSMDLPARSVVRFKPSKQLRDLAEER